MRLAICLLLLLAVGGASAAEPSPGSYHYRIRHALFGDIGAHEVTVGREAGRLVIEHEAHLMVKLLGVTAHERRSRYREVWQEDRLVAFDGLTVDNARRFAVSARAEGERLVIEGAAGRIEAPAATVPSQPSRMLASARTLFFDIKTGELLHASVRAAGPECAEARRSAGRGRQVRNKGRARADGLVRHDWPVRPMAPLAPGRRDHADPGVAAPSDELQTLQICLAPCGSDQQIAEHVRRQRNRRPVIMNDHPPTIGMAINSLAALSFGVSKPSCSKAQTMRRVDTLRSSPGGGPPTIRSSRRPAARPRPRAAQSWEAPRPRARHLSDRPRPHHADFLRPPLWSHPMSHSRATPERRRSSGHPLPPRARLERRRTSFQPSATYDGQDSGSGLDGKAPPTIGFFAQWRLWRQGAAITLTRERQAARRKTVPAPTRRLPQPHRPPGRH